MVKSDNIFFHIGRVGGDVEGCRRQAAGFRHRNMLDLSGRQSGGALSFLTVNFLAVWPPHLNVSETERQ
ncbi:hypothetical protein [Mesorhizobium cantuariense]|uniref:Uncharacterized protein n=1 Tax=Mesorhizobium cantuariense TaxID=1300275 RepID=A0ABV7MKM3_9HYPH